MTILMSCGSEDKEHISLEKIEGMYKFKYPSGQVEIISMKNNRNYQQVIYAGEKDFLAEKPLYENKGTWRFSENQLKFDHWLAYCYLRDPDSVLAQPEVTTMLNVGWFPPSKTEHGHISFYWEEGYVFDKTDSISR